MASVTAQGLGKRFGDTVAVDDLDLAIEQAEFFSLLGPSGCGKTTTLRMIAGLELPTSGVLRIGDREVTNVPPHQRGIGMVFQNYALFPHLSVAGNVAYGLRARGLPKGEIAVRVERALDRVEMRDYAARRPGALSGGQQQRVAVARAVVLEPSLLLLDEPLSNLDARLRQETRGQLRELQQSLGITTIYVTHDQEEALTLSDRIAVLSGGRLQQLGTPQELYRRPANRFVAGFIGRANLIDVEVMEPGGETSVVRLPEGSMLRAAGPAEVGPATLCVRPEAIDFGDGLPVTIVSSRFGGAQYEHDAVQPDGTVWRVIEPNRGPSAVAAGAAQSLRIAPEHALILKT